MVFERFWSVCVDSGLYLRQTVVFYRKSPKHILHLFLFAFIINRSMASANHPLFPPSNHILIIPFDRKNGFPAIPSFFSHKNERRLPFVCRFTDSYGVYTNVRFIRGVHCCHFGQGWLEIGDKYSIVDGGWVVLNYKDDCDFDMKVFDQFWTEKTIAKPEPNISTALETPMYRFLYFPFDPITVNTFYLQKPSFIPLKFMFID